jgi:hypothetical protein
MELGKNWGKVDPMQLQSFNELGQREQKAVRNALTGINQWQITKEPPKPMRVKIAQDNSFNLRSFAGVLHELGIGITPSLGREEGTVVFQPKPYSKNFLPKTGSDRVNAMMEGLEEEIADLPQSIRDIMNKARQNYNP